MEQVDGFDIPDIPKGKLNTITTQIISSVNRQTDQVINGGIDYMQDPPLSDRLPEVRAEYSDRYTEYDTVSTYYFFMNNRVPPFDKQEVREAVNTAIDSTALARLFGGRLTPTCNFLPSSLPGYEEIEPCPFGEADGPGDVQAARQMITDAGEEGTAVEVFTNSDENRPQIGQYYADLLNQIGLDAELKTLDGGVYFQTVGSAREEAGTGFANWFQDFPHPGNFLFLVDGNTIQPTNNQNFGNVDDPEINRLVNTVNAGAADDPEVLEAAAEADRLLIEKSYLAPYGLEKRSIFLSERMAPDCKSYHPVYGPDYSAFCLSE
jgi:peptide/nickel transport system substrate-binding protein